MIEIEHGSFTPLVMSAYGGVSRETERFMSLLITKIAEKKDVPVSTIANFVRTKLSFILVRSQVLCIRGSRKLWKHNMDIQEAEVVQCGMSHDGLYANMAVSIYMPNICENIWR